MMINTNFSTINKVTLSNTLKELSFDNLINAIIENMHHSDYGSSNNCADATGSGFPAEEEKAGCEDELITHAFEDYVAEVIHVKLNSNVAHDTAHRAPHIEFVTPPPEI